MVGGHIVEDFEWQDKSVWVIRNYFKQETFETRLVPGKDAAEWNGWKSEGPA